MPSLHVTKNDELLCVVGSDDVWTFSAAVWGDIWGPEHSTITVTGSRKAAEGQAGDFLVWYLGYELKQNDRLAFSFTTGSTSSPLDQTPIEEPSTNAEIPDFFAPIPEAELLKLESRTVANASCRWQFCFPGRPLVFVAPDPERQHCSLQLTWNDRHPERLRVNLSKSSLREISARAPGEDLFIDYVPLNSRFELTVVT
jgi:hypothetical protein